MIINVTNHVWATRSITTAASIGLYLAFPLLIPTLVMLDNDINSVVAVVAIILYLVVVLFAGKGRKGPVVIMSLYVLCLCIIVLVESFNNGFKRQNSAALTSFKQSINPGYVENDVGVPLWGSILMCLALIYPFYRALKAVFIYRKEIQEYRDFKINYNNEKILNKGKKISKIYKSFMLLILSYFLLIASALSFLIGGVMATFGFFGSNLIGMILAGFGVKYGRKFIVLSKRHVANTLSEVRGKDLRPPILLIRSFGDDSLRLERGRGFTLTQWLSPIPTLEEMLCKRLSLSGPVIAIGNPKEKLPPLGAAREYYDDNIWTSQVDKLMTESSHIIAILGNTESLEVEFKMIIDFCFLDKLILVLPPKSNGIIQKRWKTFIKAAQLPSDYEIDDKHIVINFKDNSMNNIILCKDKKCDSYEIAVSKIIATK